MQGFTGRSECDSITDFFVHAYLFFTRGAGLGEGTPTPKFGVPTGPISAKNPVTLEHCRTKGGREYKTTNNGFKTRHRSLPTHPGAAIQPDEQRIVSKCLVPSHLVGVIVALTYIRPKQHEEVG